MQSVRRIVAGHLIIRHIPVISAGPLEAPLLLSGVNTPSATAVVVVTPQRRAPRPVVERRQPVGRRDPCF